VTASNEIWIRGANVRCGRAVATELAARQHALVLVGRDAQRLRDAANGIGGSARVVVADSIGDIAERIARSGAAVVVNTIGPFTRTALPIARACPRGCHYVDISNELYSVIFDDAIVARMNLEHDLPTILFGTTLQPVPQPLDNQLVDDATLLREDAFDCAALAVGEDDPISADAEAAVALQRRFERLDVASPAAQIPECSAEPPLRVRRQPPNEVDDLRRDEDLHSSRSIVLRGKKRVRPRRCAVIAFRARGFASSSIVSTIASS